jgi:hypothetical protein
MTRRAAGRIGRRGVFLCLALAAGCATVPAPVPLGPPAAFVATGDGLAARFAPVFVPQRPDLTHNRVGTPFATRAADGAEHVGVDPDRPAVFVRRIPFATARGTYTNLVYRVHFTRVPYAPRFSHVSAGPNVGLLVVVTLDAAERPVLVTTVHTCGCYLAFLPTAALPEDAYPPGWDSGGQGVWGEHLPGRLTLPAGLGNARPVLWLRAGTHRVMHAALMTDAGIAAAFRTIPAPLRPVEALDALPLAGGGTTSFFHTEGPLAGYVKGSSKPLELLAAAWWALDSRVGVDKRYGPADKMRTRFYTSLKFWRRTESDMWPFADFLRYWGWRL